MRVEKWKKQAGTGHALTVLLAPMARGTRSVHGGRNVPSTWRESFQVSEGDEGCALRIELLICPEGGVGGSTTLGTGGMGLWAYMHSRTYKQT